MSKKQAFEGSVEPKTREYIRAIEEELRAELSLFKETMDRRDKQMRAEFESFTDLQKNRLSNTEILLGAPTTVRRLKRAVELLGGTNGDN